MHRLLIINGTIADLPADQVIALTKQSNDIFDFQNKRSNLSNTIKLPLTDTNRGIFQDADDIAVYDEDLRNFYQVTYIQEYEEIISYGKGKLLNCDGAFEFTIYWGNIDIVDILGDKTLRDLDLSDLNHTWNLANVKALNAGSDDVIYPVLNTHESEELRVGNSTYPIYGARMMPFVSLRRILEQIATDNNIEYSGNIEDDFIDVAIEDDRYIPVVTKEYLDVEDVLQTITSNRLLATETRNPFIEGDYVFLQGTIIEEIDVEETGTYEYVLNSLNKFDFTTTSAASSIQTNVNVIIAIETYDPNSGLWANAFILGDTTRYQQFDNVETINGNGLTTIGINEEATFRLYFNSGDKIRFSIIAEITIVPSGSSLSFSTFQVNQYLQANSEITFIAQDIEFGDIWEVAKTLPDIKQIDILKYVAAKNCYLIDCEDGTNIIRFKKFGDIVNGVIDAVDLSNYVESAKITSLHSSLSQENKMLYDNFEDLGTIAKGVLSISDNTLNPTSDFYIAPFSASRNELWRSLVIGRYPAIKAWNEDFEDVKARIYKLSLQNLNPLYITAGGNTEIATNKYIAYWDSIDSFENLITENWQDYLSMMNNYTGVTITCYIDESLFKSIDTLEPIFIQQYGAYFLIRMIKDYVSGQKVNIEIVKL